VRRLAALPAAATTAVGIFLPVGARSAPRIPAPLALDQMLKDFTPRSATGLASDSIRARRTSTRGPALVHASI